MSLYSLAGFILVAQARRVLHCSDASWAHTLVIFHSARFSIPLNIL